MRRKERLPILAVTCGDPAGVGPEIAVRAAVSRDVRRRARLVLVGPESVWSAAARVVGVGLRLVPFERRGRRPLRRGTVEFVPTAGAGEWRWGKISAAGGETAFRAVEKAVGLVRDACCDAVVTAPLNKESLRAAGVPYIRSADGFFDRKAVRFFLYSPSASFGGSRPPGDRSAASFYFALPRYIA